MVERTEELTGLWKAKQRKGLVAVFWIAVLSLAEFAVAVALNGQLVWPWLVPIMAAKGWLIMDYFMHIRDLEGGEH